MKKRLLIITCLSAISSAAIAQQMSPAQQGFAYQEQQRMWQQYHQQNDTAQQRAQQRRQQAYINRMRNKKWYGAIVKVVGAPVVNLAAGYHSKRGAIKRAMDGCENKKCTVLATFANTCAMSAVPDHDKVSLENHYIAFDKVGHNAIVKAVRACEAVHGGGACSFAGVKGKNEALCAGYEYGHYGQR